MEQQTDLVGHDYDDLDKNYRMIGRELIELKKKTGR